MSETLEAVVEAPAKPVVASAGKPVSMNRSQPTPQEQQAPNPEQQSPEPTEEEKTALAEAEKQKLLNEKPQLTKEEIKALYEREFPTEAQQTEEQKKEAETARKKRMQDLFFANGGEPAHWAAAEGVLQLEDLTELSKNELTIELKAQGFNEAEIAEIQQQRYFQIEIDNLEIGDDETEEEFVAKKEALTKRVKYGTEKLLSRGQTIKKNAEKFFSELEKAVSEQDLQAQQDAQFIAKIDEVSKQLPRKITVQLGKLDNNDLGMVETDVPEAEIAEITAILKDPAQRNQILYTEDGNLNIQRISELLQKEKMLERIARESLLEGQTRQVAIFDKTFGSKNPHAIGVGGSTSTPQGQKGKVASFGKPQVVNKSAFK